ncbi:uncharacterized protein LOC122091796 [Macadamia integrifolia]|uniref:uncharacterized protein LOC122091796 n=1 Tax=Macadamia integrifolia TaxID=60698 RepID=UPI001C4F3124|nr:uncharacterized protein LOC122091796 [Macadamia integrifolia]
MKVSGRTQLPAVISTKTLFPKSPDSDIQDTRSDRRFQAQRRKIRNPGFSGGGVRLKKDVASVGKKSGPATPLLRWKFDDADLSFPNDKAPVPERELERKARRKMRNAEEIPVSARKLASALWKLQLPEVTGGSGDGRGQHMKLSARLGLEPHVSHMGVPFLSDLNSREYGAEANDLSQSPLSISGSKNGALYKVEPSFPFSNSAMEGATKWGPGYSETPDEVYRFYDRMKLLEDQRVNTVSAVSALQVELEQARNRIHELETEHRSSKKKLEHFLRKLAEERAAWRNREHDKIRAIIDDVKDDLNRERKNRQRLEIVNSKLVNELAEAKLSAKRFMQEYEKEKKSRELMEEVCDELAKEIGEDKTEVESLKRESMKIREEVDEERRMLQMAEVWREERVQMKLVDAKLTLEEKYSQLSKLIADLEAFLRSRSATLDVTELREVEFLREAASSVKIHDIKEFSYEPPTSEDIFSVLEDLQAVEANEREIEPCAAYSPASHASKVHTVSPDANGFIKNHMQRYSNGSIDQNEDIEDGSGWETVSHAEDQGSSYSAEGSDPSVNRICQDSNVSESGTEWEDNAGHDTLNTETSKVCPVSARHSKKKVSSITRLWKSCPSNGENYKIVTVEGGMKGRISNGRISNGGIVSPDQGSGGGGLSPRSLVMQWPSPDSGNPHIARGMKGCIEWPRGIQKNSLKAKLLEARMESQKIQLRQVLKQKI